MKGDKAVASTAVLLTTLVLTWGFLASPQGAFDDAYITYRYADNLRQGHGLLYNSGEWVLGTTTPFFTLLLGLFGILFENIEWLGHWLSVFSWLIAAGFGAALMWDAKRPFSGPIAGLLIALHPLILTSLGMESALLIALMLAVAWLWLNNYTRWALPLMAALLLTRQDTALWLLIVGLEVWRRQKRLPIREGVLTAALTLPWFGFAYWRYGSVLPNSVQAKVGQNDLMPIGQTQPFAQRFLTQLSQGEGILMILLSSLLLLGIWVIWRQQRQWWWLVAWLFSYLLIYQLLGVVAFPWYFVPPTAVFSLIGALAFGEWLARPNRIWQMASILTLLIICGWWGQQTWQQSQSRQGYRTAYREIGHWLAENASPQADVATIEIGVVGYLSKRPILDTMGLISPDMTTHLLGWRETLVYAITTHQPAYALVLPDTAWDWIKTQWWFTAQYQPVATFTEATLYQRVESAATYQTAVNITYTSGITFTHITLNQPQLQPNSNFDVRLHYTIAQPQPRRYRLAAYLIDTQTDERYAITSEDPFYGGYHSDLWQVGDELTIPLRLPIPEALPIGAYRLGILVTDPNQNRQIRPAHLSSDAYPEVKVGWLRYGEPPTPDALPEAQTVKPQATWQDGFSLTQISIPPLPSSSTNWPVQLTWHTIQTPRRDWTLFLHLVDEQDNIVAQRDQRPFDGRFPTPVWSPQATWTEQLNVSLPPDLPNGSYGLRIGFYDENGRLLLADGASDYILLPDIVESN